MRDLKEQSRTSKTWRSTLRSHPPAGFMSLRNKGGSSSRRPCKTARRSLRKTASPTTAVAESPVPWEGTKHPVSTEPAGGVAVLQVYFTVELTVALAPGARNVVYVLLT